MYRAGLEEIRAIHERVSEMFCLSFRARFLFVLRLPARPFYNRVFPI